MATTAYLHEVKNNFISLREACSELSLLRHHIEQLVGSQDGIQLSLSKCGLAFDLVITLKPDASPAISAMRLQDQSIAGVFFTQVASKPAPRVAHRKLITAKVVPAEQVFTND